LNDLEMVAGDGVAIAQEAALVVATTKPSELMLFDLP